MNAPEVRIADPYVLNERDGRGVVTLTLNRPQQFNALSEEMLSALQSELEAVAGDAGARVVVIAGKGKAFCPGHDLKQMKANPTVEYYRQLFAQCAKLMMTIQRLPQPVIARVHGIATAAGCQLVAMCDLAVAADHAEFALPDGVIPGMAEALLKAQKGGKYTVEIPAKLGYGAAPPPGAPPPTVVVAAVSGTRRPASASATLGRIAVCAAATP